MRTQIFNSYRDFLDREDKDDNGVSPVFAKSHPDYEEQNSTNRGCWNCLNCTGCWNCLNCTECEDCLRCEECEDCLNCTECEDCFRCMDCFRCVERIL